MAIGKPLLVIDKFTGSGDGGICYNEGFVPGKENGQSFMREGLATTKVLDDTDTGFTTLKNVRAVVNVNAFDATSVYRIILDDEGGFFIKNLVGTTFTNGLFTRTSGFTTRPDMFILPSGNIAVTLFDYVGLLVRGKVKTGSNSTSIIDSSGRNFETLGLSSSAGSNKVMNLNTGSVYTITSITDGVATKDKLNFDAVGATTNAENAEFIALAETGKAVSPTWSLSSTVTYPVFVGQPSRTYWDRQIKQYGDDWYILNGNYLAKLDKAESIFADNFKRLPYGFQALSFDVNTDRILVSCRSNTEGFRLLLWDGYSLGWNNILRVDSEINCIKAYKNGWIYITNGVLYFTDGYQIQKLQAYSDKSLIDSTIIQPRNFNGIVALDENIFSYSSASNLNRALKSVYVWNKDMGWSIVPTIYGGRTFGTVYGLFTRNYIGATGTYAPTGIDVGLDGGLNTLTDNTSYTNEYINKSFIYFAKLPSKVQVKQIELNISPSFIIGGDISLGRQTKISVNIGDGNGNLFSYNTGNASATTTRISAPGDVRTGTVGDQVQFTEGTIAGERMFIESIVNKGLSNERWNVTPAFSAVTTDSSKALRVIRTKSMSPTSKTVDIDDFSDPLIFSVDKGFLSDKLYIEVVVHGVASSFPIAINSINVY